jgi:outer membrane protein assembly factor BamB
VTVAAVLLFSAAWVGIASGQTGSAWTEYQGGPARTGAAADGPAPGYRVAWSTSVAPGGPGSRYGLSAPILAGDVVVAVGPEQVLGLDIGSGEQAFTVDRDLGPSLPAATTSIGGNPAVVYTQGWGDGPPEATPDPEASPEPEEQDDGSAVSSVAAFDLETQRQPWPPVRLDGVSRTGVTVAGGSAVVGVNDGTVTAIDVTDGSVRWQEALGGTIGTSIASVEGLVLVGVQGDRDTQPAVVALDEETGEQRWRHEPSAASAVVSAVSAGHQKVFAIFAGLSETSIAAIGTDDGAERWSRRVGAAFDAAAPPVVGDDVVVTVDLLGHARAFDIETGEQRWDFALNAPVFRSVPAMVGSSLLVPTIEGELAAIDVETGELVWRSAGDGAPLRSLAVASEAVLTVRAGARSGIEALEHDPDASLVREASPTTLALGRMLGAMAIAAIPLFALVVFLGRLLAGRMGPAFPDEEPLDDDEEPVHDPWEDEEPPK